MENERILIVEDDESLAGLLRRSLVEEGYSVDWEENGPAGLERALSTEYACILLDWMLPGFDGVSLCRRLRDDGRREPVIMLTVKSSVEDKVEGLNAGADDYVSKPFSLDELLARIQAQVRRHLLLGEPGLSYEDLRLDPIRHTARRQGRMIELTPKEYALLDYFVHHPEQTVTEKELIRNVWGMDFDPRTNVLNVYLHRLRNKIDKEFSSPLIHTLRGRGYRLSKEPP